MQKRIFCFERISPATAGEASREVQVMPTGSRLACGSLEQKMRWRILAYFAPFLLTLLMRTSSALACAVCYGPLDSSLVKGARAGMIVLLVVTGCLLSGIVAVALFWMRRSKMANLNFLSKR